MAGDNEKKARGNDEKTGWDKLGIIFQGLGALGTLIAIPITVGYSVYIFNAQQASSASQVQAQQATSESQAVDQQRQTALDNYLSEMSSLELDHKLSSSQQRSAVNAIAARQAD